MPTIFRETGYRFFFYSNEGDPREPVHVHVRRNGSEAKFWLNPEVAIASSDGFNAVELTGISRIVHNNRQRIERAWHDHFGY